MSNRLYSKANVHTMDQGRPTIEAREKRDSWNVGLAILVVITIGIVLGKVASAYFGF